MKPRAVALRPFVVVVAVLAGATGARIEPLGEDSRMTTVSVHAEGQLPSLGGATAWLNSAARTPADLRGKVVVVDFWTYTCVNWLRTLPYVRAWAEKYKDHGLVVIGVHTPEFSVEKDVANVRRAAQQMRVEYPIAVDSDYAIWKAFHNEYWPALYVVDAQGRIRFHHFGEGEYEQSERVIQQLLVEAGAHGIGHDRVSVDPRGAEVAADWSDVRSEESYVGYQKAEGFASPGGVARDTPHAYTVPPGLGLNQWALLGDWNVGLEIAALQKAKGRIAYRFHARDLNLVMGPGSGGVPVRFRVLLDGHPPGPAHGYDVDDQGNGMTSEPRLYQLIRQPKPIVDRLFEIEFLDPVAEAFVFTFG
jgi:thiol-disulfide isomerase/thioredoxin